jgi:hypothetical protein
MKSFCYARLRAKETSMIDQIEKHTSAHSDRLPRPPRRPVHPDENFYEDEEQLAAALAAALPEGIGNQPRPVIDPAAFETLYAWFLS